MALASVMRPCRRITSASRSASSSLQGLQQCLSPLEGTLHQQRLNARLQGSGSCSHSALFSARPLARASRPNLKVLFATGYTENAVLRGDFLDPGMDMLTKPFALDALGAKVRMMIER